VRAGVRMGSVVNATVVAVESFVPRLIWGPDMTRGNHDA